MHEYLNLISHRALLEAQPDGVCVLAPDGSILEVNSAALTLFAAASPSTLLGKSIHHFIESGFLDAFKGLHRRALYGEAGKTEFDLLTIDQRTIRIESRSVPLCEPQGGVTAVMVFLRDISDKYQADLMAQRLAAIVESSEDIIIGKDLTGTITSWNSSAERILGYTAAEMIGQSIIRLIPLERRPEEDLILGRIRAGGRVEHFDTERLTKDGRIVQLSITVSPIRDREGRVVGASKIARDISERVVTQSKLARHAEALALAVEQTRTELERSNEALRRSERLAAMGTMAAGLGHDIGNLLLPMRSSLEMLKAAHPTDPDVLDAVKSISRCADYFASMVRGLRLFGRGEQDDAPGDHTNITSWAQDILPLLRNLAGTDVNLVIDVAADLPLVAFGPGALTQAITNLVKNSIDAFNTSPRDDDTPNEVHIRAFADAPSGQACITVTDNGPGMSAEVRRHCLEPYYTTHARGQQAGTGMGLALVHRVVTSAGGRVAVVSEPNEGTTISICLPTAPEPSAITHHVAHIHLTNSAPVSALVTAMLRAGGYETRATPDPSNDAELWVLNTLDLLPTPDPVPSDLQGAIILLSEHPTPTHTHQGRQVYRIPPKPSVSDFMRCLENVRRDRAKVRN